MTVFPGIIDHARRPQGSLPMAVLKEDVNQWIANTLAGKPADQLPFACKPRTVAACSDAGAAAR
ncbi:MAG: hypothetical protein EPN36_04170 [Rhodanobacteraceae bacterium]|nr:MAG: hypothetical protein EPN36_04170 [Rhodanobacteraceae bacterium]